MKSFLALLAASLLAASCISRGPAPAYYLLNLPGDSPRELPAVARITMPEYLCSQEFRYCTPEGELRSIHNALWAIPLNRLLRTTLSGEKAAGEPDNPRLLLNIASIVVSDDTRELLLAGTLRPIDGEGHGDFSVRIPIEGKLDGRTFRNAFGKALLKALETAK